MRVLSLFHNNNSSLALFGLFLQEVQAKKAAKTAQNVQLNYGYSETKRESVAGNSNRDFFFNCCDNKDRCKSKDSLPTPYCAKKSTR